MYDDSFRSTLGHPLCEDTTDPCVGRPAVAPTAAGPEVCHG